jgi:cytochrome c556
MRFRILVISAAVSAAGCHNAGVRQDGAPLKPVATVRQVMEGIVIPYSQAIFDAVAYTNGELVKAPANDDDWFRLQTRAVAVAEAGNLLMMAPRARDNEAWMTLAREMNDKAANVAQAAANKDVDQLLDAGGALYETCTACHNKYVPQ